MKTAKWIRERRAAAGLTQAATRRKNKAEKSQSHPEPTSVSRKNSGPRPTVSAATWTRRRLLEKFVAADGKGGGEFFTPKCVVKLLIEPFKEGCMTPASAPAACSFRRSASWKLGKINLVQKAGQDERD